MWICPNCNFENQGNFCFSCGTPRPEETLSNNSNIPNQTIYSSDNNQNSNTYPPKTPSANPSNILVVLCSIVIVLLCVVMFMFISFQNKQITTSPLPTENITPSGTPEHTNSSHQSTDITVPALPPTQIPSPTYTQPPTPVPTPPETTATYSVYTNSQYNIQCEYPSDFNFTSSSGSNVLKALISPDSSATILIRARRNDVGMTISRALREFYDAYDGNVNYEYTGSSYYIISINRGSTTLYRKFFIEGENFYCLDLEYSNNNPTILTDHLDYISNSFHLR